MNMLTCFLVLKKKEKEKETPLQKGPRWGGKSLTMPDIKPPVKSEPAANALKSVHAFS